MLFRSMERNCGKIFAYANVVFFSFSLVFDIILLSIDIYQSLDELKLIDLSDSQKLIETPDFSGAPNLKHLILRRCTKLYKIHASLRNLKWLIQLDLNGCKCLEILPPKISLESLEVF